MVKKLNLIIATLYSVILATVETLLNNYWNDWEYFPLWIVDYFIAIILLSAVFLFKDNYQKKIKKYCKTLLLKTECH